MRTNALAITAVALLIVACEGKRAEAPADVATSSDIARLEQRLRAAETDALTARKAVSAEQVKNEELRRRIADVESKLMAASAVGTQPRPVTVDAPQVASTPSARRRGGFTDFGESVANPALPRQSAAVRRDDAPAGPITRDPDIISRCGSKWGTNYEMVAYCQREQQKAKDTWLRGNAVYGTNDSAFTQIRSACTSKWGTDYEMRVYCESEQVKAYAAVNAR